MKETKIIITTKFGSKFQKNFAENSLMAYLKSWKAFLNNSHKNNNIKVEINESDINILDFFNF